MRVIPGMTVINPSDAVEARAAVRAAYELDGPVYLRFGRLAVPVINDRADYQFEIGKGVLLKDGKDLTIIATGLCVSEALEAAQMIKAAKETGKVVTVEEHSVIGGLGGAVAESLCEKSPAKLLRIGIEDTFGESGPAAELIAKYGLDAKGIYSKIKAW